jgi:hypothetical protein
MSEQKRSHDTTKREFLQKATYVVPAVLTLAAAPSFASAGSDSKKNKGKGKGKGKGYKNNNKGSKSSKRD